MQGALLGTGSRDPGVTPWAEGGAQPLSPPGIPETLSNGFVHCRMTWGTASSFLSPPYKPGLLRGVWQAGDASTTLPSPLFPALLPAWWWCRWWALL